MTQRKPSIRKGPASYYAASNETIMEFSDGASGGLISIRRHSATGRLIVEVYRIDDDVTVLAPLAQTNMTTEVQ